MTLVRRTGAVRHPLHLPLAALLVLSLSLLAAYGAVLVTRPIIMGQSRLIMWIWYSAACAVAMGMGYALILLSTGNLADPISVLWQYLASVALFPFADQLIERFEDAAVRFR